MSQVFTYEQLAPGLTFSPVSYTIDARSVANYLEAIGSTQSLNDVSEAVPPVIIAALSMKGMMEQVKLDSGSIHLSQELEFLKVVSLGETVTCRAGVGKKHERAGLKMVSFEMEIFDSTGEKVMTGKALVGLPGKKA
ncbi:MAG: MaoC family dehydratase N-terminal domain-containing protein [Dehalococcoidia bacterium]|nr:MaoC family dehydratase N-terminal domain-containing protein [Dehalococcoidia bacterium]